jgi:hypothetical protein
MITKFLPLILASLLVVPVVQECDTTSPQTNPGPTVALGDSRDQETAKAEALEKLKAELAVRSKVQCGVCPGGLQCRRTADCADSTLDIKCEQVGNSSPRWVCTAGHAGAYTVTCNKCP